MSPTQKMEKMYGTSSKNLGEQWVKIAWNAS
jgi:hypothetical protein